jgi:hypothetical protein
VIGLDTHTLFLPSHTYPKACFSRRLPARSRLERTQTGGTPVILLSLTLAESGENLFGVSHFPSIVPGKSLP